MGDTYHQRVLRAETWRREREEKRRFIYCLLEFVRRFYSQKRQREPKQDARPP